MTEPQLVLRSGRKSTTSSQGSRLTKKPREVRRLVTEQHKDIELEDIPAKIEGTYEDDYDIVKLDRIIRAKIERDMQDNKWVREAELADVRAQLETDSLEEREVRELVTKLRRLQYQITRLKDGALLAEYQAAADPLLEQYRKASAQQDPEVFGRKSTKISPNSRLYVVEAYLKLAAQYIELNLVRQVKTMPMCCPQCMTILPEDTDDSHSFCPQCNSANPCVFSGTNSMDGEHSGGSSGTNPLEDDSLDNFMRAIIRFQGMQSPPPVELYDVLDQYFTAQGMPIGAEVKKLPLNDRGRRGDTDHAMILNALAQTNNSGFYDDVNLIGHQYFGWKLPNIAHLVPQLKTIFIETQRVFYSIPVEQRSRTSSLNVNYRLWRTLEFIGHKFPMSEFKIAHDPDSLREHDKLWNYMVELAHLREPQNDTIVFKNHHKPNTNRRRRVKKAPVKRTRRLVA